jgi:hypothetical protein
MPHGPFQRVHIDFQRDGVVTSDEFLSQLTPREQEVTRLIAQLLSNEQIAQGLILTCGRSPTMSLTSWPKQAHGRGCSWRSR